MSIYLKICTGLIVSLLSLGAQADDTNPQILDQPSATESLDVKDTAEVIQALYVSSLTQMKVADLVREKSPDQSLRDFADRLTRDHRWINRSLGWFANIKSVSLEPEDLGASAQLVDTQTNLELQTLAQIPQDEFRSAFLTASIRSHQEALQFYNRIDQDNNDNALKILVKAFRQVEEVHLANAQKLQLPDAE